MLTPGRKFSAGSSYRYGFNGKENDKDISAGAQDYGMRISDSRIGKFLSVDPLTPKYPELTPYQFASNSPISGIDLDGLEYAYYMDGTFIGHNTKDDQGKELSLSVSNSVRVFENSNVTNENTIRNRGKDLDIDINTFLHLSAFGYNENTRNSYSQQATENIIINRSKIHKSSLEKVMGGMAGNNVGTTHEERMKSNWFVPYSKFITTDNRDRNSNLNMKTAIQGAINACSGNDITNGAVYEKGRDFFKAEPRKNGTNWPDYIDFRDNGFKWQSNTLQKGDYNSSTIPDHIGNTSKGYKYIGLASYGGNVYLIDNPEFKAPKTSKGNLNKTEK